MMRLSLTFLLLPAAAAFQPLGSKSASSFAPLRSSTIDKEDLVTKEANIKKSASRTQPTIDPFNPDFQRIQAVPYNEAFPSSTKEYKKV